MCFWLGAISYFLFLTVYGAESKKSFQGARGKWGDLKLSVGGVIWLFCMSFKFFFCLLIPAFFSIQNYHAWSCLMNTWGCIFSLLLSSSCFRTFYPSSRLSEAFISMIFFSFASFCVPFLISSIKQRLEICFYDSNDNYSLSFIFPLWKSFLIFFRVWETRLRVYHDELTSQLGMCTWNESSFFLSFLFYIPVIDCIFLSFYSLGFGVYAVRTKRKEKKTRAKTYIHPPRSFPFLRASSSYSLRMYTTSPTCLYKYVS